MDSLHRCKRCGHSVPLPSMTRVHWGGKQVLFCGECYRELIEQRTGYRQAKVEFEDQVSRDSEQPPF